MNVIRKRTAVALGAAAAVLVLAGSALAVGPPASPPRLGPPAKAGAMLGYGVGPMTGGTVMQAAADYIGVSVTALAAARHDGTSLAQVAVQHGKTAAGLKQAVVTAFTTRLDAAVAAGTVTKAQAEQLRTQFEAQVQTMLERTDTGPLGGPGGLGAGLGPCGGMRR